MGKNWAIVIGINDYDNLQPLKYAQRDAEAMQAWFEQQAKFDQVFLFTENAPDIPTNPPISTKPTYGRLRRFFRAQFEQPLLQTGDNFWFFFAGHGKRYGERDYIMLSDSDPGDVENSALSVSWITQRLRRCGADNIVMFLDACRDEDKRGGLGIGEEEHQGVITFYSCNANQPSWEIDALQHGSFTYALLEGLKLQGESNCATVERLARHLYQRVPQLNANYKKQEQNPRFKADPPYKMYFILLKQSATYRDTQPLIDEAQKAELEGDLLLAERLWKRLWGLPGVDDRAFSAIQRIAVKKATGNQHPIAEPVIKTSETGTSSRGETSDVEIQTEIERLRRQQQEKKYGKLFEFEVVTIKEIVQPPKLLGFLSTPKVVLNKQRSQARYVRENLGNGVTLDMVYISGDRFMMGSPKEEGYKSEKPQHEVTVQAFYMGKYQITQAQWKAVAALPIVKRDLKSDPSNFKGDNLPVEQLSWHDAVEFCDRISKHTGKQYRLPTEAEWEYACRAGTTTPFHFGKTITGKLANYDASKTFVDEPKGEYRRKTTPVGQFPPNGFGLYDMHGNVWEWCADYWHENYEGAPKDGSAWVDSGNNSYRVLRGGSWVYIPGYCRSAYRVRSDPSGDYTYIGLRVLCVVAPRNLK